MASIKHGYDKELSSEKHGQAIELIGIQAQSDSEGEDEKLDRDLTVLEEQHANEISFLEKKAQSDSEGEDEKLDRDIELEEVKAKLLADVKKEADTAKT